MELLALFLIPVIVWGIIVYRRNHKQRMNNAPAKVSEPAPEPDFTVLYSARDWVDANLLASKLSDAGIEPFLADDAIISANPLLGAGLGGIKVKVKTTDLEHAHTVLDDFLNPPAECPKCSSSDTELDQKPDENNPGLLTDIALGLTVGPHNLKHYKTIYRCNACGHEFEFEFPEEEGDEE